MPKIEVYKCKFCGLVQWLDDIKDEYKDKYYVCNLHCNKYCHYCECADCIIDMSKEKRVSYIRHKMFIMRQAMDGFEVLIKAIADD